MALDLIKEYLVGIGFKVDNSSFGEANSSINQAQDNIKKFNKNNEKGFSESGNSLKDLFSLFNIFSQGIGKLSPELRAPFQNMIKDILVLARIYSQFNEQFKKQNTPNREKEEQPKSNSKEQPTQNNNINRKGLIITPDDSSNGLIDNILNIKEATKKMESEGGEAVSKFSLGAVAKFALVTTAAVAVVAGIAKIISGLFDLAKQDIENEKLSRQLWTTKENAKEVDMAMKTLGVSMQDLWLSPTLLKQFNQLRQDSVALKLPKEYTDNLKVVQGIGLEFSRLRQLGTLAFQWIGNYILKYAAGPLNDIKQGTKEFNEWLIKNIPGIAKVIGTVIGTIIRMLLTIIETIGFILSTIGKLISYISSKIPESGKEIIKIITLIGVTIMAGPVGAIIILILLIEDVMTYFKGGKSVIGSFF